MYSSSAVESKQDAEASKISKKSSLIPFLNFLKNDHPLVQNVHIQDKQNYLLVAFKNKTNAQPLITKLGDLQEAHLRIDLAYQPECSNKRNLFSPAHYTAYFQPLNSKDPNTQICVRAFFDSQAQYTHMRVSQSSGDAPVDQELEKNITNHFRPYQEWLINVLAEKHKLSMELDQALEKLNQELVSLSRSLDNEDAKKQYIACAGEFLEKMALMKKYNETYMEKESWGAHIQRMLDYVKNLGISAAQNPKKDPESTSQQGIHEGLLVEQSGITNADSETKQQLETQEIPEFNVVIALEKELDSRFATTGLSLEQEVEQHALSMQLRKHCDILFIVGEKKHRGLINHIEAKLKKLPELFKLYKRCIVEGNAALFQKLFLLQSYCLPYGVVQELLGIFWEPSVSAAVLEGNLKSIQFLMDSSEFYRSLIIHVGYVNDNSAGGYTLLAKAIFWDRYDLFKLLLDQGFPVNFRAFWGKEYAVSHLRLAIIFGVSKYVEDLLNYKALLDQEWKIYLTFIGRTKIWDVSNFTSQLQGIDSRQIKTERLQFQEAILTRYGQPITDNGLQIESDLWADYIYTGGKFANLLMPISGLSNIALALWHVIPQRRLLITNTENGVRWTDKIGQYEPPKTRYNNLRVLYLVGTQDQLSDPPPAVQQLLKLFKMRCQETPWSINEAVQQLKDCPLKDLDIIKKKTILMAITLLISEKETLSNQDVEALLESYGKLALYTECCKELTSEAQKQQTCFYYQNILAVQKAFPQLTNTPYVKFANKKLSESQQEQKYEPPKTKGPKG